MLLFFVVVMSGVRVLKRDNRCNWFSVRFNCDANKNPVCRRQLSPNSHDVCNVSCKCHSRIEGGDRILKRRRQLHKKFASPKKKQREEFRGNIYVTAMTEDERDKLVSR